MARIEADRAALARHREGLVPPTQDDHVDVDLLEQLRSRLKAGLTDAQRHEIVRLLVGRITISTTVDEDGKKDASAMITYKFPTGVQTRTVRGSSRRRG